VGVGWVKPSTCWDCTGPAPQHLDSYGLHKVMWPPPLPAVQRLVCLGWVGEAIDLLGLHSAWLRWEGDLGGTAAGAQDPGTAAQASCSTSPTLSPPSPPPPSSPCLTGPRLASGLLPCRLDCFACVGPQCACVVLLSLCSGVRGCSMLGRSERARMCLWGSGRG
jgi:hypothetical protein